MAEFAQLELLAAEVCAFEMLESTAIWLLASAIGIEREEAGRALLAAIKRLRDADGTRP